MEEHNGWHVTRYNPATQNASEIVVFALATVADTDPLALAPLHRSIDPDALDDLFAPTIDGRSRAGGKITFVHDGYTVVVSQDGEIRVRDVADVGDPSSTRSAAESD